MGAPFRPFCTFLGIFFTSENKNLLLEGWKIAKLVHGGRGTHRSFVPLFDVAGHFLRPSRLWGVLGNWVSRHKNGPSKFFWPKRPKIDVLTPNCLTKMEESTLGDQTPSLNWNPNPCQEHTPIEAPPLGCQPKRPIPVARFCHFCPPFVHFWLLSAAF